MYTKEMEEIKQYLLKTSELLKEKPKIQIESSEQTSEILNIDDMVYVIQDMEMTWSIVSVKRVGDELLTVKMGGTSLPVLAAKLAFITLAGRKAEEILENKQRLDS